VIPLRDLVPVRRRPWVTYGLIAANVVIFGYKALLSPEAASLLAYRHGLVPVVFVQHLGLDTFGTVFTSMFLHGDFWHLLSNMWFLHIFGDNIEDALGRLRFLLFYLAAGMLAALTHVLIDVHSPTPMIGASGAIAGVLGAYIRLFPRARVVTLIPILVIMLVRELPAVFFIVVWFLIQLLYGFGSLGGLDQGGGVAFFAHIGGFVAGLLLVNLFGPQRNDAEGFASPAPPQRYRVREPWEP
jgi:membrane associated rhomboid family serine protease